MSAGQVIQRMQDLETVVVKQLDRALSKVQDGMALCWTTVTTTIGQVVDTRVLGKVHKWNSSGKAWPKWSFVMKACDVAVDQQLSCRDQYGCGEQRAAWRSAVVCRPDHVVHRKSSGLCCECNAQLGHGGMENVLSCVFPVERCETCCIDARSVGNFAGHGRCAGVNLDAGCIEMTSIDLNALSVDAFTKGSKGASKDSGERQDSEFVCRYCEKQQ